ncbi:zinc finger CCCH domain-containing protein 65-like isoform X2 [Phragmites australis]|uniref:zinc finger CCCH domain-containing protein 65-like isoform X2 n=1 Tax=Phragmites australis TaxID=29695 RepID=UPI002D780FB3|nr:zinc finger CCCH domain-containing protein 65-like isoform X2 [Phragmites australis]
MADADAKPPPPDASSSPIASVSPSSGAGDPDAAAAAIEKQLAGLGLAVAGGGGFPEPSGWEDGPVPLTIAGGCDEVAGENLHPPLSSPPAVGADARPRFPRRPGEPDCTYYLKFGNCRFGVKCKFNHPTRKKKNRVKGSGGSGSGSNSSSNKASSPDDDQGPRDEYEDLVPDIADSVGFDDKGSASNSENHRKTSYEIAQEPEKGIYFKKLDETNSTNHKGAKDKRKETVSEGSTQEECKYYSTPGGCKFGKVCKYLHREGKEGKTEVEKVELNFLGLPLRPGAKECPYYMRTGSCKYATNCKFHHPDPSNVQPSKEPALDHENGDTSQQNIQGPSQPSIPIWPDQRALNEQHVPFLAPAQSYSAGIIPPQGMYPSPDWSGYHQVTLSPYYPPGVPFQHFPAAHMNHPMYKVADIPGHQQLPSDEYPERPGQPECQHFVRSGFCKYRMKCRFHHPRSRLPAPLTGGLSPLGLPIKPDQPVCTYYGRFGVCKYGPACMFNHPFNFGPPVSAAGPPLPGQYPTPGNFAV